MNDGGAGRDNADGLRAECDMLRRQLADSQQNESRWRAKFDATSRPLMDGDNVGAALGGLAALLVAAVMSWVIYSCTTAPDTYEYCRVTGTADKDKPYALTGHVAWEEMDDRIGAFSTLQEAIDAANLLGCPLQPSPKKKD